MSWARIDLLVDEIAADRERRLQADFRFWLRRDGGRLPDVALFQGQPGPDGISFYLSPGAAALLPHLVEKWGGAACDAPVADDLILLIGHSDVRERLLAQRESDD